MEPVVEDKNKNENYAINNEAKKYLNKHESNKKQTNQVKDCDKNDNKNDKSYPNIDYNSKCSFEQDCDKNTNNFR
jgi:hypothetical protein